MPSPRIIEHPMDDTVLGGQTAMFVCVGQGYGLVDVMWFRGNSGSERSPPERSAVTTIVTPDNISSILTIPDVNDGIPKLYRCKYNNSGGETDSYIARLTIGGKH